MPAEYDAAVIGGGFFGCVLAVRLRRHFSRVVLLEKQADLLQRASYANQARVHNGYHYPRSLRTALRSRVNFPCFVRDYAECIDRSFQQYYAIARHFSHVSADYFELFCRRIEAPICHAPPHVSRLFDPEKIEAVFQVEEVAFDAVKLKERIRRDLAAAGVEVRTNTAVRRLSSSGRGSLVVECATCEKLPDPFALRAEQVFLCTYSQLNQLLADSGQPLIPVKHELAELALVNVPEQLRRLGVTVMCGPFFSCMPFPARGLHSLSHVRYTPHCAWQEGLSQPAHKQKGPDTFSRQSNFPSMVRDASRYLPLLGECRYCDSLWEVKTVLQASEVSDSRPILFQKHVGLANLHCILGAKIDNSYDLLEETDEFLEAARIAS